jgi:glycosyltransferase involved in cell wall biosynthesis
MTNIHLQNVDLTSRSGPNCFGRKLFDVLQRRGVSFDATQEPDAVLAFIQALNYSSAAPLFQRLDGIYFNTAQNYSQQNQPILNTYQKADGVIFQSDFNKTLITKYFGDHPNSIVIHNGSDLEYIKKTPLLQAQLFQNYEKIWVCASHWRPHKRLKDNIQYFLDHSGPNDVLLIMGHTDEKPLTDNKIKYLGNIDYKSLITILKVSDCFIHLAWLDHCPNVVVDARACGCEIICSSSGGTKEIAGRDATLVLEEEWDFEPVELYSPPTLDFTKKVNNEYNSDYDMEKVADRYLNFMRGKGDE